MLILASQSAARKTLLAGAGLRFEASPATIDERGLEAEVLGKGGDAVAVALALAEAKALSVATNHAGAAVIGADQVLAVAEGSGANLPHGVIPAQAGMTPVFGIAAGAGLLHKPQDMADAARQLDRLRGMTHQLHSAVVLARDGVVLWSAVETATLTMRAFSDAERDQILALEGAAALGSVGAYRLEGPSVRLFERIEGDYFTILGLPLLPLLAALRQHAPDLFE